MSLCSLIDDSTTAEVVDKTMEASAEAATEQPESTLPPQEKQTADLTAQASNTSKGKNPFEGSLTVHMR